VPLRRFSSSLVSSSLESSNSLMSDMMIQKYRNRYAAGGDEGGSWSWMRLELEDRGAGGAVPRIQPVACGNSLEMLTCINGKMILAP
jgi:hypothetical protein